MLSPLSSAAILAAAAVVQQASAVQIDVSVGQNGLVFTPDTVTAAVGDTIAYHFFQGNHSVVQGTFGSGCQPASGGFFSGFMPVTSGEGASMFVVTITSTSSPLFFYCGVPGHCRSAMVGVVNPSSSQPLDTYAAASRAATNVGIQPAVVGGQVLPNAVGAPASSSAAAPPASSAASSAAAAPPASSSSSGAASTGSAAGGTTTPTTTAAGAGSTPAGTAAGGSGATPTSSSSSAAGARFGPSAGLVRAGERVVGTAAALAVAVLAAALGVAAFMD